MTLFKEEPFVSSIPLFVLYPPFFLHTPTFRPIMSLRRAASLASVYSVRDGTLTTYILLSQFEQKARSIAQLSRRVAEVEEQLSLKGQALEHAELGLDKLMVSCIYGHINSTNLVFRTPRTSEFNFWRMKGSRSSTRILKPKFGRRGTNAVSMNWKRNWKNFRRSQRM